VSSAAAPPPDPFQVFREAYDKAAESWSKSAEQLIATEEFAAAAGKMVDRYADLQEAMRRSAETTVEYMHIPSKEDVARLAQLVINVERKADEIGDELYGLRRSLDGLPERIAGLVSTLESLEARIEAAAAAPVEAAPARRASASTPAAPKPRQRRAAPKEDA
jgi:polyhydroxyalkanoic acid synthase PhaR subunit